MPRFTRLKTNWLVVLCTLCLSGCAIIAVVDTAATVAVKTVGLAADVAIGTVKVVGGALLPSSEKAEPKK